MPDPTTPAAPAAAPAATTGPVPFEQFDLAKHIRSLLPSPEAPKPAAVEKPAETPATAAIEGDPADAKTGAKPEETPAEKTITARMAALDRKQRQNDETLKKISTEQASLAELREIEKSVAADPIGFLKKRGVDVEALILEAIGKTGDDKPKAEEKPADMEAPRKVALELAEDIAKRGGARTDLVMAAEADGIKVEGRSPRDWAIEEVERRYAAGREAGDYRGGLTRAQYAGLMRDVLRDLNDTLAEDAEFATKHRKAAPAPPAPAAEAKKDDEPETPTAITSALGGSSAPTGAAFKTEAEFRDYMAKKRSEAPTFRRQGRFT